MYHKIRLKHMSQARCSGSDYGGKRGSGEKSQRKKGWKGRRTSKKKGMTAKKRKGKKKHDTNEGNAEAERTDNTRQHGSSASRRELTTGQRPPQGASAAPRRGRSARWHNPTNNQPTTNKFVCNNWNP